MMLMVFTLLASIGCLQQANCFESEVAPLGISDFLGVADHNSNEGIFRDKRSPQRGYAYNIPAYDGILRGAKNNRHQGSSYLHGEGVADDLTDLLNLINDKEHDAYIQENLKKNCDGSVIKKAECYLVKTKQKILEGIVKILRKQPKVPIIVKILDKIIDDMEQSSKCS